MKLNEKRQTKRKPISLKSRNIQCRLLIIYTNRLSAVIVCFDIETVAELWNCGMLMKISSADSPIVKQTTFILKQNADQSFSPSPLLSLFCCCRVFFSPSNNMLSLLKCVRMSCSSRTEEHGLIMVESCHGDFWY